MADLESIRQKVFERAGGRCECRRSLHLHIVRCDHPLLGDWAVHQSVPGPVEGIDPMRNVQGLCVECLQKVSQESILHTSGRHRACNPRTVQEIYG
jgi:hypothetical protein